MPDRFIPKRWRLLLQAARAATYLGVAAMGITGLVWQPTTIAAAIGQPLTYWWTGLSTVGALVAMIGVLVDRYRIEWVAIWPAIGGTVAYAATVWGIVAEGQPTRSAQACAITTLTLALIVRAIHLAAHAAQLREEHRREA